ncbi:MAG: thermonuclease family protein [Pseudomonadota bacterium]
MCYVAQIARAGQRRAGHEVGVGQRPGYSIAVTLTGALAACGAPGPMDAFEPGETARVVRIIDGDALVLDTGQSVRLVGVEAPSFGRNGEPDAPHAEDSRRMLEDLVLGREVRLYYAGLTRDRYDRALAHVETADRLGPPYWVNDELVRRGAVRVRAYPDTSLGADALHVSEQIARETDAGLWAVRAYQPRDARDVSEEDRGFTLVTGILGRRDPPRGDEFSCRRVLLGSELTVRIEPGALAACDAPEGQRVEVRGWLSNGALYLNASVNLQALPGVPMAENTAD